MKTIHSYYSNIPCQGKDCIFWGGEYQEEKHYSAGYDLLGLHEWHEEFTSIWHGEHCSKSSDLGQIRQEIYNRALAASDEVHRKGYKVLSTEIKKAGEAFDKITDEWRKMKCPFYEVEK